MLVMMLRHYFSILLSMSFLLNASAQNEGVVTGAGGNNANGNLSLRWTIGSTVTSSSVSHEKKAIPLPATPDKSIIMTAEVHADEPGNILLYPNPAGDILNIQFDIPPTIDMNMILLDSRGNQVKNIPVESSITEKQVNLHNIPSGIYYIRMIKDDMVMIYKVVKL